MKSRNLLFALLLFAVAVPALAQSSGFYAGGGVGRSTVKDFCDGASSCKDTSTGLRAFGGYQVNPYLGAELGYSDMGKVSGSSGSATVSVKGTSFEAVGVASLPIGKLAPYAKLGAYRATSEASSNFGFSRKVTNSDATYGAGLRVDITQRVGVRAEFQRYRSVGGGDLGKSDVDVLSVSGLFRF